MDEAEGFYGAFFVRKYTFEVERVWGVDDEDIQRNVIACQLTFQQTKRTLFVAGIHLKPGELLTFG